MPPAPGWTRLTMTAACGLPVVPLMTTPSTAASEAGDSSQETEQDFHAIAFPHSPQNFIGFGNFAPQCGQTVPSATTFAGTGLAGAVFAAMELRRRDAIDLGQHRRQFLLQRELGLLIIGVRKFADAIFELQVAQIFVDRRFAIFQMLRGGNRLGRRHVLGADEQREQSGDGDHEDDHGDEWH